MNNYEIERINTAIKLLDMARETLEKRIKEKTISKEQCIADISRAKWELISIKFAYEQNPKLCI